VLLISRQGNYSRNDLFHLAVHDKRGSNWNAVAYENAHEQAVANAIHGNVDNVVAGALNHAEDSEEAK